MAIDIRANFIQYDAIGRPFGVDGLIKAMDRHSIEKAVLVPGLAVDTDFRLGNKELFETIRANDRLYGYLVVNPNYPDESIQIMRNVMNSRKFLAMALFNGASLPYPNADDYRDIINAYRRFGKPIYIYAPHADAVCAVEVLAQEFPGIKFILGSMGGCDWKRGIAAAAKLLNIVLETSGSFDAEKIEEAVEQVGAHRILFGSGMPFSEAASMLALIQSSNIPKDAMTKILGDNAKKFFGLDTADPEEAE